MTRWLFTWWLLPVWAALGIVTGSLAGVEPPQNNRLHPARGRTAHAVWVYRTTDLSKMVRDVHLVVIGAPINTEVGRTVWSSNGESSLTFEIVDIGIQERLKGSFRQSVVRLERVAMDPLQPHVLLDPDGGPYELQQRYLLFLNKQPESSLYYLVNDDARFAIGPDERLHAVGDAPIAKAWNGRHLAEMRTAILLAAR